MYLVITTTYIYLSQYIDPIILLKGRDSDKTHVTQIQQVT